MAHFSSCMTKTENSPAITEQELKTFAGVEVSKIWLDNAIEEFEKITSIAISTYSVKEIFINVGDVLQLYYKQNISNLEIKEYNLKEKQEGKVITDYFSVCGCPHQFVINSKKDIQITYDVSHGCDANATLDSTIKLGLLNAALWKFDRRGGCGCEGECDPLRELLLRYGSGYYSC